MEAGKKLSFIQPFEIGDTIENEKDTEAIEEFSGLCVALLDKYSNNIKKEDIFRNGEYLTVFESSLRILADDGSYLHAVIYGHAVDQGMLDFAISVNEHQTDGTFNGGYIYTYDIEGLSRQFDAPDQEDDDPDTSHFSILQHYHVYNELSELQLSDDMEARIEAAETIESYQQKAEFTEWANEMGFDGRQPSVQEIISLRHLLIHAEPYVIPT